MRYRDKGPKERLLKERSHQSKWAGLREEGPSRSHPLFPLDKGLALPRFDGVFCSGMLTRRGASKLGRTRSTWITVTEHYLIRDCLGKWSNRLLSDGGRGSSNSTTQQREGRNGKMCHEDELASRKASGVEELALWWTVDQ